MNLPRSPPPPDDTPWLVLGDFNLTRFPQNKNNDLFNHREASLFNDAINSLGLIELPLLDRAYTWSNRRDTPTLARLDRAFVNLAWDHKFPNTNLSSLTRFNSDHVPLKVTVSTAIPRSHLFRFENSWLLHNSFCQLLESSLAGAADVCTGSSFSRLLKRCRKACRSWARRLHSAQQREIDTKILINGLDLLEEARPLSAQENILRTLAANSLHSIAQENCDAGANASALNWPFMVMKTRASSMPRRPTESVKTRSGSLSTTALSTPLMLLRKISFMIFISTSLVQQRTLPGPSLWQHSTPMPRSLVI